MLVWLAARPFWNWVTDGLASASFRQIASVDSKAFNDSAGLPVSHQQDADLVVARRQVALELGDRGVGVSQFLPDRQRRLESLHRLVRFTDGVQQVADVDYGCPPRRAVNRRQWGWRRPIPAGSSVPTRGPSTRRPACRSRLTGSRYCRSCPPGHSVVGMPAGLASASFRTIAKADSWAFNPSAGFPVALSRIPILLWLLARLRCNFGNSGVGVNQLLADGQRQRAGLECLGWIAGVPQQGCDVVVTCRQVVLELVDGGVGVS